MEGTEEEEEEEGTGEEEEEEKEEEEEPSSIFWWIKASPFSETGAVSWLDNIPVRTTVIFQNFNLKRKICGWKPT